MKPGPLSPRADAGHPFKDVQNALPPWVREVDVLLPVMRQFILTGNVEDFHAVGSAGQTRLETAADLLSDCCRANDFDLIYSYDPVGGITLEFERTEGTAEKFFSPSHLERSTSATLGKMADLMRKAMLGADHKVAIFMYFAARMWRDEQHAGPDLRVLLGLAEKLAHSEPALQAPQSRPDSITSTIFWFTGQDVAAPRWLADGDQVQTISVPKPELGSRLAAASALMPTLPGYTSLPQEQASAALLTFARLSEGMTLRELSHIVRLAVDADVPATSIEESIRSLRFGVVEGPGPVSADRRWGSHCRLARPGPARRGSAVPGCPGPRGYRPHRRPRWRCDSEPAPRHPVFCRTYRSWQDGTGQGPGRTALRCRRCLYALRHERVSAEHSEARLIGAPPGYVGFGAGGELTNAVRQKPFSILLFDEIEKAHPRILDKFLQILEDGRLTDGAGDTVYFSETVIIFTSNLGTYRGAGEETATARVARRGDPYEITEKRVHEAITHHFTEELQRPEILNRIGNNIVVFDFISEPVARKLAEKYLNAVVRTVESRFGLSLAVAPAVARTVTEAAVANLDFGGRGVSSAVETAFVNPLARALMKVPSGTAAASVTGLREGTHGWEVTLSP
jgi:ATP-dependent Clp protease ATP-binding subunit ClpB